MFNFRRRKETKISLYGSAIIVLALGCAALARGGTTMSAFLLAIAYCVLIPLAIWGGGSDARPNEPEIDAPPYAVAGIVAACVLALYLATMAPSTAMWDTSEYIAAAYTFGLPHPPGNPFFVIIGRVFSILPIAPTVAARINVLAALSSAISAGLWFLVAEQVMRTWIDDRRIRYIGAGISALIGATAFT